MLYVWWQGCGCWTLTKGVQENRFGYWFDNMRAKTVLEMLQFDIVCGQKNFRQQCVKRRQSVVPKSFFKTSRI